VRRRNTTLERRQAEMAAKNATLPRTGRPIGSKTDPSFVPWRRLAVARARVFVEVLLKKGWDTHRIVKELKASPQFKEFRQLDAGVVHYFLSRRDKPL